MIEEKELTAGVEVKEPAADDRAVIRPVIHTDVREEPLSVDEVVAAVSHRTAGGIALFLGVVRDHDHGRSVTALDYSAHPSAAELLAKVAEAVAAEHPAVVALSAIHRVGALAVGDLAVVVGAAAPHRAEAFAACRAFIDTLKEQVPIWKREEFADGDHEWVGC
ncbi:molybdenum cofactor biosynthesis protein MoaE [Catenulispora pinisilvae]|uniref:molybdenum cofactor biosynthesis protein MoaE n=1 Tax=Catenulispora pinisilvae TaxID=2705253 RepID=UPI002B26AD37|nr:molybdenum cofactor biosynthesis protein MoaE [Catenulispora pinisilvae]